MAVEGTIFDIKKFAIHDGPGIRTTVFFKGCPLDCAWCHNPESRCPTPETVTGVRISGRERTIGGTVTTDSVMIEVLKDEIFYDQSGGGVTFSGGEPMMQPEFLDTLLRECHRHGLHTAVDTCGYAEWVDFEKIREAVDLFLFDLKVMDDGLHQKYIGVSNANIHENARKLVAGGSEVLIRIPMIADVSDTDGNLDAVADFVESMTSVNRIDLLPYNKFGEDKVKRFGLDRHRSELSAPSQESMNAARSRLASRGFAVNIGG